MNLLYSKIAETFEFHTLDFFFFFFFPLCHCTSWPSEVHCTHAGLHLLQAGTARRARKWALQAELWISELVVLLLGKNVRYGNCFQVT